MNYPIASPTINGSEIAIIGMAGRFPGAKNVEEFWQNLQSGVESISFFSDEELLSSGIEKAVLSDPNYVKARAVLEDVELFDASFFGFNPREAEVSDPQQRLFLESAWQAIENAGYNSETYEKSIGVYAGTSINSYFFNLYSNQNLINSVDSFQLLIGSDKDFLTTRVSYKLNLTGPSYTVQTACSTSLVAVHLACQSLLNGECDMALAGGVSISASRKAGYFYKDGAIGSPDGHCRAFDAKAQGTVSGEGVGIVVLKRLEDALADGDSIHAVIKGSAINNDGSFKVSYTAPRIDTQAKVIRTAQVVAEVEPETITYIEAHGTGTSLGDPIEIAALTQAFRSSTEKKGFCAIGSVKTNIGHLDAAAGVTGLIKTVLALKHQKIPPSLHFEQPNPQIDFANSPFYVNTILSEWKTNGTPRRAGVSSFGIGGTNAHVILEEAPAIETSATSRPWQLLLLSAKTSTALETATTNLTTHLQQHPDLNLADVAYTQSVGRRAFDHRRMVVSQDINDAVKALSIIDPQRVFTHYQQPSNRPVVFMFSGQGTQYVNMGRELYQSQPIFTQAVDNCCELLKPHLGLDLRHVLYPNEAQKDRATEQLQQTFVAQPALFSIEYALAQLWMAWGVHPETMIGHSIGEYVAATLAGVFSLEDALALVAKRGRLMQQLSTGEMLSVQLPEQEVQPLLGTEMSLAATNGPAYCVVSGPTGAIERLHQKLQEKGIGCRKLHTSHAFHSQMMEPILEPFSHSLQKVTLNPPKIPFVSNVSGTWITAAEATHPKYWVKHLRQTVRFSSGIAELIKTHERILLEIGPGRTLSTFAKQHHVDDLVVLTSIRHPQEQHSDVAFLLNTLGRLWLFGVKVDWSGFYANEQRHHIPLPTYPFERQRYWIERQKQELLGELQPRPTATQLWKYLVEAGKVQACASITSIDEQTYLANKQSLDNLCTAYINLALSNNGAFSNSNDQYSLEELFERYHIIPRYQQLLCRWLDVLVQQGHLQQKDDLYTNLVPCSTDYLNALVEEVKIRWVDRPHILNLVTECGENLPSVLCGEQEPLGLYFSAAEKTAGSSKPELFLDTYFKAIIRASMEQVVKLLPPDVNLRILEIGGGQGIVTTELLTVLPPKQTKYTFTDVGGWFLNRAQEKFSAYPFVEYRFLDIQKPPTEQGYSNHSVDVVVAVNVLHVTQNMGETLEHVRSLLAPGGFLLLWEITEPQLEFDITDGLLMNPVEDKGRSRGNPFLSKEQWQQALQEHGFVEVAVLSNTEAFEHHVFVAQASASADFSAPTAFTTLVEPKDADQIRQVSLDKKSDIANWFYIPSWKRSMPPQPLKSAVETTQSDCWLVFVDECGLGETMVKRLANSGQDVITVKVGEQFSSQKELSYTINPRQRDDYDALLQELRAQGKVPKTIVHLWSVTQDSHAESAIESLDKAEALGFYSLLFLAQALGENNQTDSVEIGIVSNNMQEVTGSEVLCPEKALVLGPVKVIPQEYPNITCRSIDVVIPAKQSRQEDQLIEALQGELITQTSDQVIAYRGTHRWVQDFQPVRLEGGSFEKTRLREQGLYLITGGLGGVGLALAEYLAQTVQAKLVLIGRSPFPDRDEWSQWLSTHDQHDSVSLKIQKLQALEALGAQIMVVSADVANLEQMSVVLKQVNHQFGQIHGVIHAAGVYGGGMIQLTTKEAAASALAPKVRGTRVLETVFKDTELDFFVMCSSLSSFQGTPGMMDYTAENAFLDAFAHYSASQNGTFTKSINWDRWNSIGMAAAVEARHKEITGEDLTAGMTYEEGIEAFRRILHNSTVPQLIVSTQDFLTKIQPKKSVKSLEEQLALVSRAKSTHKRPNLANAYVAPRNEVERTLVDIWQQLLGIELLGIHDNFFELGGDSLFATQLVSQLCKTFQIELPYKNFFDSPTVAELAEVIVQKLAQQTDDEALAQALADIEQLSEDEVLTILALEN
ncbi:polyketide synthase [Brasilonema octagenarum UFV-E1]|uniref:Phenolphthiocerol/phthiocerol polyketide synthase subunit E n=1 Tax=Brasilonema sennae CENA114 TaxID=415709 RepID=A0A856MHF0_9CYAN|nr:type I polyketide synthase [Brasilonema sennae]QDL10795.1 polyketide synthase [Brasilonema sennae CENA114]QDL17141.1 polyketide synthase [Brasilonema octagenarum UFV-E1]